MIKFYCLETTQFNVNYPSKTRNISTNHVVVISKQTNTDTFKIIINCSFKSTKEIRESSTRLLTTPLPPRRRPLPSSS